MQKHVHGSDTAPLGQHMMCCLYPFCEPSFCCRPLVWHVCRGVVRS
jgi:hypothetical protein